MSKCLLHKSKLDDFLYWCNLMGIEAFKVEIDYQVARVRVKDKGHYMYASIYKRDDMKEHFTVEKRLEKIVYRYIRWTKS